jgi:hypothetical protein
LDAIELTGRFASCAAQDQEWGWVQASFSDGHTRSGAADYANPCAVTDGEGGWSGIGDSTACECGPKGQDG